MAELLVSRLDVVHDGNVVILLFRVTEGTLMFNDPFVYPMQKDLNNSHQTTGRECLVYRHTHSILMWIQMLS